MTTETIIALGFGRAPKPGELCGCGRPAVVVYPSGDDEVGDCGIRDGGAQDRTDR